MPFDKYLDLKLFISAQTSEEKEDMCAGETEQPTMEEKVEESEDTDNNASESSKCHVPWIEEQ